MFPLQVGLRSGQTIIWLSNGARCMLTIEPMASPPPQVADDAKCTIANADYARHCISLSPDSGGRMHATFDRPLARRALSGSKACSPKRGAFRSRITSLSTASSSSADSMPPSVKSVNTTC